jgi:hypothetical protein
MITQPSGSEFVGHISSVEPGALSSIFSMTHWVAVLLDAPQQEHSFISVITQPGGIGSDGHMYSFWENENSQ